MPDPTNPTLMTKLRAKMAGERDTVLLEALRVAGRAAYDELMAAERTRDELTTAGTALWDAPAAAGSHLLAAWNAFVLQTLGEGCLDADYAASPGTVGYVPPVTFDQTSAWLGGVEDWVSRARQARSNPDYDITAELALPAELPPWAEEEPCPPEHLAALLAAIPPIRAHVEVALHTLERAGVPAEHGRAVNQLRQLTAQAAAAADYATSLPTTRHHSDVHELIEKNLRNALELWFHVGQLAAMPRLLASYRLLRPIPPPDPARLPGGPRFDPWCLTDPASRERWQRDRKARQAINRMWQLDPDPAATLTLKAEIDEARLAGDIATHRITPDGTCYYECPWAPVYEVRRTVRIGGRFLVAGQEFTLEVTGDDVRRGGTFQHHIIVGPFNPTDQVGYNNPDGGRKKPVK